MQDLVSSNLNLLSEEDDKKKKEGKHTRGRERNKGNICVSLNLIRIVSFFHQHQKDSKQFFKIFSKLGEATASFPLVSFFLYIYPEMHFDFSSLERSFPMI